MKIIRRFPRFTRGLYLLLVAAAGSVVGRYGMWVAHVDAAGDWKGYPHTQIAFTTLYGLVVVAFLFGVGVGVTATFFHDPLGIVKRDDGSIGDPTIAGKAQQS